MADVSHIAAQIARYGETLVLRRVDNDTDQSGSDVTLKGIVRGYQPQELAGDIIQGDLSVIISNDEIDRSSWPGPPLRYDRLFRDGLALNVQSVETRRLGDAIALHVLQVRG